MIAIGLYVQLVVKCPRISGEEATLKMESLQHNSDSTNAIRAGCARSE